MVVQGWRLCRRRRPGEGRRRPGCVCVLWERVGGMCDEERKNNEAHQPWHAEDKRTRLMTAVRHCRLPVGGGGGRACMMRVNGEIFGWTSFASSTHTLFVRGVGVLSVVPAKRAGPLTPALSAAPPTHSARLHPHCRLQAFRPPLPARSFHGGTAELRGAPAARKWRARVARRIDTAGASPPRAPRPCTGRTRQAWRGPSPPGQAW